MSDLAIKLQNIGKKYVVYHEKPTLVENILFRKKKEEFWALRNINLIIKKGEILGIIGPNGSGKTTLLEIIAGITTPTKGHVQRYGKVVSLIELGAGFQPDLTGEENIFLNGMLIGLSKSEIKTKFHNIISFADLGKFIDAPMYTYSEGMKLRLGFSLVIHSQPDVLILDEGYHLGDKQFHKKSKNAFQTLARQGLTIIIASHWHQFLKTNCSRIISLENGRLK